MKLKKRKQHLDDDEQKIIDDYERDEIRVRQLKSNLASSTEPILDNLEIMNFERRDIKKEYRLSLEKKIEEAGEGTLVTEVDWMDEVLRPGEIGHFVQFKCGCGRTWCTGSMHFG